MMPLTPSMSGISIHQDRLNDHNHDQHQPEAGDDRETIYRDSLLWRTRDRWLRDLARPSPRRNHDRRADTQGGWWTNRSPTNHLGTANTSTALSDVVANHAG
jgi:hypothetical protein